MSLNKNIEFNGSELLIQEADDLYWEIISINTDIENYIKGKNQEKRLLLVELSKVQKKCEESTDGHMSFLYETSTSEVDRDIYRCQKCGKTTT